MIIKIETVMLKSILSIACVAAYCSCHAQHSLTVKLSDLKSDTVVVSLLGKSMRSVEKSDTVITKNGEFTYDVTGDKARRVMIVFTAADGPGRMIAYAVPGEQGVLTGTSKHCEWSGSKFYSDLASLEKQTDPLQERLQKIAGDFMAKAKAGADRDSLEEAIMPEYRDVQRQLEEANLNFIKANPQSDVSITLCREVEDMEAAYNLVDTSVKTGKFSDIADAVKEQIDAKKAREEAAKKVAPGCEAPDFTLNDIDGKPLSLSSLRGKYLVLDFWGSWCGWCIKGFPEMKKYYEKYSGKFEILGVDCNDTEEKWKEAVKTNGLSWKHVYCPRGNKEIITSYAIQGYPTKIVIDPEGKIVKTIVGEDPAFYTFLDELFK